MQSTLFHRRGRRADIPVWALKPGKAETVVFALIGVAFFTAFLLLVTDSGINAQSGSLIAKASPPVRTSEQITHARQLLASHVVAGVARND